MLTLYIPPWLQNEEKSRCVYRAGSIYIYIYIYTYICIYINIYIYATSSVYTTWFLFILQPWRYIQREHAGILNLCYFHNMLILSRVILLSTSVHDGYGSAACWAPAPRNYATTYDYDLIWYSIIWYDFQRLLMILCHIRPLQDFEIIASGN